MQLLAHAPAIRMLIYLILVLARLIPLHGRIFSGLYNPPPEVQPLAANFSRRDRK